MFTIEFAALNFINQNVYLISTCSKVMKRSGTIMVGIGSLPLLMYVRENMVSCENGDEANPNK